MKGKLNEFIMDYANNVKDWDELKRLRALFTAYCLVGDVRPDSLESDMELVDIWHKVKEVVVGNSFEEIEWYRMDENYEAEYCHSKEDCIEEAFNNFMYEDLL